MRELFALLGSSRKVLLESITTIVIQGSSDSNNNPNRNCHCSNSNVMVVNMRTAVLTVIEARAITITIIMIIKNGSTYVHNIAMAMSRKGLYRYCP